MAGFSQLFFAEGRMRHDGMNSGTKREILLSDRLVDLFDMGPVGQGHFTAMGVADEFAEDALEDALLVSHEGGL